MGRSDKRRRGTAMRPRQAPGTSQRTPSRETTRQALWDRSPRGSLAHPSADRLTAAPGALPVLSSADSRRLARGIACGNHRRVPPPSKGLILNGLRRGASSQRLFPK